MIRQCRSRPRTLGPGLALLLAVGMTAAGAEPAGAPLFPFVLPWDDARPGVADASSGIDRPAGKDGPVVVRDGHLFAGGKRLRLFGVNLCFGANFPRHDDAAKVAARLAGFGINAVRFHHMDMQRVPGGIFAADGRTLDPGQLDRLDFLIARLKERGIYADLNLHVSRTYPDAPTGEGVPTFHKGVDQFVPRLIEQQREYARALLGHVNPYTKSRYADEPAVALVEINNENALLDEWWGGRLDDLPPACADELARQWNAWLAARHPDFAALRAAWGVKQAPLGGELLTDTRGWNLERHGEAKAAQSQPAPGTIRVDVSHVDGINWHVQLVRGKLAFRENEPYTLQFRARADVARRIGVNAMQDHDPWRPLWTSEARLTADWQTFRFTFLPSATDDRARLGLSPLGDRTGTIELADFSLKPGGVSGLDEGDRAGQLRVVRKRDYGSRTPGARNDWMRFLWETEARYWTGMARFLKEELKVRSPLVGTQMGWSPAPIQAELDVIDSHSYWQHPHFPGRGWDAENWTVQNVPMAGAPDGGTLPRLALSRVAGKPFICTEYNHSAPNTYASEAFPLLAACAALQDWDGIFAFAYSHRGDDWDTRRIPGFFDIDQHPTKMVTLPASAALFLRGDLRPFAGQAFASVSAASALARVAVAGPSVGADAFGVDRREALRRRVGIDLGAGSPGDAPSAGSGWTWGLADGRKTVLIDSPRSKAVVGAFTGAPFDLGGVRITPGPTLQDWAVVTLTARDGAGFDAPGRLLITATGLAENTAMGWKNAQKTTVGRDWGTAPSLVEGIAATIALPSPAARTRAWALDERGQRGAPVPVRAVGDRSELTLGPRWRTLWYEVEIRGEN